MMVSRGQLRVEHYLPLVVIAAGLLVYQNSFSTPFILDDGVAIVDNLHIRNLWPLQRALSAPPDVEPLAHRPVISLSLAINYALGGVEVWGYHAFNLAVHLLVALVLYGIVRRTLLLPDLRQRYGKAAARLALAVALIWVVHPLQTSSVTYITQRSESVMSLFYLLTIYCVLRGVAASRRREWYEAAIVCCALGMGSKQVMVTAPVTVLLYDRVFLARSFREIVRQRWGLYAGLAATWVLLGALVVVGPRVASVGIHFVYYTIADAWRTQCAVLVHYLRLAFWPHPLVFDYDWPVARALGAVLPYAISIGALLGGTLWALRRAPWLGFLGGGFLLILLPSSLLPMPTEIVAEHRMYLPLAAVVVLVVIIGRSLVRRLVAPRDAIYLGTGLVVALVVALGIATHRRNVIFQSDVAIWRDVITKQPTNIRARGNLGFALARAGKLEEAIAEYDRVLDVRPGDPRAENNLGVALARQGKVQEAMSHFIAAVQSRPAYAEAHANLGQALAKVDELDAAIAHYAEAQRLRPGDPRVENHLGVALARQGRFDAAIVHFAEAERLNPGDEQMRQDWRRALADHDLLEEVVDRMKRLLRESETPH